jgi:hypothetical protein
VVFSDLKEKTRKQNKAYLSTLASKIISYPVHEDWKLQNTRQVTRCGVDTWTIG